LVAEDSVGQRVLVRNFLRNWGAIVSIATNGKEAVDQCFDDTGRTVMDVVLMDGMMPVMDGLDACRVIREREKLYVENLSAQTQLEHVPVIVIGVSGMTEDEDKALFIKSGMDKVVTKPFKRNVLYDTIMGLLDKSGVVERRRASSSMDMKRTSSGGNYPGAIGQQEALLGGGSSSSTIDLHNVILSSSKLLSTSGAGPTSPHLVVKKKTSSPIPSPPMLSSPVTSLAKDSLQLSPGGSMPIAGERRMRKILELNAEGKSQKIPPEVATSGSHSLAAFWRSEVESVALDGSGRHIFRIGEKVEAGSTLKLGSLLDKGSPRSLGERDVSGGFDRAGSAGQVEELMETTPILEPQKSDFRRCSSHESRDRPAHPGSAKILVVDDQEANLMLMTRMLKKKDFYFEVARDGSQACMCASKEHFDCILMDCNMPIMDGWEATERIRSSHGLNDLTPIIAVTANAMAGDRERCLEKGMSDYMSKPVNKSSMFATIEKWLGKTHLQSVERDRLSQDKDRLELCPAPAELVGKFGADEKSRSSESADCTG
jgi:CheY-like chemotaxis protein